MLNRLIIIYRFTFPQISSKFFKSYLFFQIHIYTFKSIFIHICRTTSMYCYLYSICYIFCVCLWNNRDVLKRFSKERKRMNQNKLNEAKKNISKNKQTKAKKKKKKANKSGNKKENRADACNLICLYTLLTSSISISISPRVFQF